MVTTSCAHAGRGTPKPKKKRDIYKEARTNKLIPRAEHTPATAQQPQTSRMQGRYYHNHRLLKRWLKHQEPNTEEADHLCD